MHLGFKTLNISKRKETDRALFIITVLLTNLVRAREEEEEEEEEEREERER